MANKVLIFLDSCIDMSAKLARVVRSPHCDPKAVVHVKLLAHEVDALETAKHVSNGYEARPILVQLCLDVHYHEPKQVGETF